MDYKDQKAIETIKGYAKTNSLMQTISGALGFPVTTMIDGTVILTHYLPMIKNICEEYGYYKADKSAVLPVIKGCFNLFVNDFIFDKILGNIPLIGVFSNFIFAKVITWRLGLLFSYFAKHDIDINEDNVKKTVQYMNELIHLRSVIGFQAPSKSAIETFMAVSIN